MINVRNVLGELLAQNLKLLPVKEKEAPRRQTSEATLNIKGRGEGKDFTLLSFLKCTVHAGAFLIST